MNPRQILRTITAPLRARLATRRALQSDLRASMDAFHRQAHAYRVAQATITANARRFEAERAELLTANAQLREQVLSERRFAERFAHTVPADQVRERDLMMRTNGTYRDRVTRVQVLGPRARISFVTEPTKEVDRAEPVRVWRV